MFLARRLLLARVLAAALAAALARGVGARGVAPVEVMQGLPGARIQGQAWMRFMGLRVYEARLWTAAAVASDGWAAAPLALEIEYARTLKGAAIAERSLAEMRRQGAIEEATAQRWLQTLQRLFPDVAAGDRLTALYRPGQGLQIFANGELRGSMDEPLLAERFLGIWLARQTSEPALRTALLGREVVR